jgi:uncharacterized protein YjbI with pentapeptide repeats
MTTPKLIDCPMYQLLRGGQVEEFNRQREAGTPCDLRGADLRNVELKGMNLKGLDMTGAYLRQADLRGLDLSETRLEHASIRGAHVSGTLFPKELDATEIALSLEHGIRMRYR